MCKEQDINTINKFKEKNTLNISARIYNYQVWVKETSPDKLKTILSDALKQVSYTVLNSIEHYFPVKGYTCLWLLAESHLAVHTFPNEDKTYIELSGCNEEKSEKFMKLLEREFNL